MGTADAEIAYLRTVLGVPGGTLNDLRMQAYGGTGTQQERAAAFWRAGGATGGNLQELEGAYLRAKLGSSGPVTLADLRAQWFKNPVPPATTVATETWTGVNGSAWPSQWVALANNGVPSIQGNRGNMFSSNTGYTPNRRAISGLSVTDVELYLEFQPADLTEAYLDFSVRQNLAKTGYFPDGYFISCDTGGAVWTLGAIDTDSGQFNQVDVPITWKTVPYGLRLRAKTDPQTPTQSVISGKIWELSGAEPAGWQQQITDSNYQRAGSVAIGYSSGNTTNPGFFVDNLTVQKLG